MTTGTARADVVPLDHQHIAAFAMRAIMPCLIVGTSLAQQRVPPMPIVEGIGQALLWVGILAALEIVLVIRRAGRFAVITVGAMLASKAALIVISGSSLLTNFYSLSLGALLVMAAATIMRHDEGLIHRQLLVLAGLSLPVMVLQIIGSPEVVHALRTDIHDPVFGRVILPTLVNPDPNTGWSTIQGRPAGFMYANNFFSLVLLMTLAIHLGASTERTRKGWDWVLGAVIALAMAKIVALALIVLSALVFFADPRQRARLGRLWFALFVSLAAYYAAFPGLFVFNVSFTNLLVNFTVRFQDLRAVLTGVDIADVVVQTAEGGQWTYRIEAGSQSGYARIARLLPALAVAGPLAALVFLRQVRRLRHRDKHLLAAAATNVGVALVLAPLITAFFGTPFLAFAAGVAAVPFLSAPARRAGLAGVAEGWSQVIALVVRRRTLVLGTTATAMLLAAALAAFGRPRYTSTALFYPEDTEPDREVSSRVAQQLGVSAAGNVREGSPEFFEALLRSNDVMHRFADIDLTVPTDSGVTTAPLPHWFRILGPPGQARSHETVKLLREILFISANPRTGTVRLRVRTRHAALSRAVLDSLMSTVDAIAVGSRRARALTDARFIEERIGAVAAEWRAAERAKAVLLRDRSARTAGWAAVRQARLDREIEMKRQVLAALENAYAQFRMTIARTTPVLTIAEPPRAAVRADPRNVLAAAVRAGTFALLVGLTLAITLERLRLAMAQGDPDVAELAARLRRLVPPALRPAGATPVGAD